MDHHDCRDFRPLRVPALLVLLAVGCSPGSAKPTPAASPCTTSPSTAATASTVPTTTPPPNAGVIAHDEGVVSGMNGNCAAFEPDAQCPFASVTTAAGGAGNVLYGILLTAQTGGDCFRGIGYLFDGEHLVTTTGQLPPNDTAGGVVSVATSGANGFAVGYGISPSDDTSCAANGSGATDTYVYRWNGAQFVVAAGAPPLAPRCWSAGRATDVP
jgi:hypothetical protein